MRALSQGVQFQIADWHRSPKSCGRSRRTCAVGCLFWSSIPNHDCTNVSRCQGHRAAASTKCCLQVLARLRPLPRLSGALRQRYRNRIPEWKIGPPSGLSWKRRMLWLLPQ